MDHDPMHLDRTRFQATTDTRIEDRFRHKDDLCPQKFAMLLRQNEEVTTESLKIVTG
jgi:hypothetical protein